MLEYLIVGCLSAVAYELVAHMRKRYKVRKEFNVLKLQKGKNERVYKTIERK